jgi:hypothetical protein
MSSKTFAKAVTELATLSEKEQAQVLSFIATLKQNLAHTPGPPTTPPERYPLRGESYAYIDPLEPATPAEQWNALGEDK